MDMLNRPIEPIRKLDRLFVRYLGRLIAAAGIKQDYRTSLAQAQLINWCMFNGQWLGQVSPFQIFEFVIPYLCIGLSFWMCCSWTFKV
jgi:hypothetical protein